MKFRRTVVCKADYVEDGIKYWSEGKTYDAIKHHNGEWSIRTNEGNIGIASDHHLCDFDTHFAPNKTTI